MTEGLVKHRSKSLQRAKESGLVGYRKHTVKLLARFDVDFYGGDYDSFRAQCISLVGPVNEAIEDVPELCDKHLPQRRVQVFDLVDDQARITWDAMADTVRPEAIDTIRIGDTEYRLRRPSSANATPNEDRTWEFHVETFEPQFVGRGNSIAEAKSDFYLLIHSTFQSLVRLRPFRMTEEQISKWNILETAIDVEEYWRTVPVTLRELGIVSSSQRGSRQVLWLDGKLTEEINVDQVPAEFFSFAENQWFEAIVEREPGSHKLRRLIYVQQVDPVRQLTEDERRKWFDSLPGSDSLPKSDLTWKTI